MKKRRRKNRKKTSKVKRIWLILLFIPLCFLGLIKTIVIESSRWLSRSVMKAAPSLWRGTFGRWSRHRGDRFEDYSERKVQKDGSELLPKDALGAAGERFVFEYVRNQPKSKVVACNVENYYCELDLIYLDLERRDIVFVEVKTRRREDPIYPTREAVDARRRKKIALAARKFVRERGYLDYRRRYDVVVVIWPESEEPQIKHYENAFSEIDAIQAYRAQDYGKTRRSETDLKGTP